MVLSRSNVALVFAYIDGYRVVGDEVISPYSSKPIKLIISGGYYKFSYKRFDDGKSRPIVWVHRLVALQKYGSKLFDLGVQVRHLDGDRLNFLQSNIAIGSQSENMFDIPEDQRKKRSVNGIIACSRATRRWTNREIEQIRKRHQEVRSYSIVMKEFNISSKGALHYILHNDYLEM